MTEALAVYQVKMPTKMVEVPDYAALAQTMLEHKQVVMDITSEEARAADMGIQRVLPGKGLSLRSLEKLGKKGWLVTLVNKNRSRAPSEKLPSIEELESKA